MKRPDSVQREAVFQAPVKELVSGPLPYHIKEVERSRYAESMSGGRER